MNKNEKARELFSMYEDVNVDEDGSLKVDTPVQQGSGSMMIRDDGTALRSPGYAVSRTFEVPDGTYKVGVKLRTKVVSNSDMKWWTFVAEDQWLYHTPSSIPPEWTEYDAGDSAWWKGKIEVDDGVLGLEILYRTNRTMSSPTKNDSAYLDWVEFRYEKVD